MDLLHHPDAPYRYVVGIDAYSAGVIADPGFELVHINLRQPEPWRSGLEEAWGALDVLGLPHNALCGVELRCRKPHTFDGFKKFNAEYRNVLDQFGLLIKGGNPVARTNVSPVVNPPKDTTVNGFTFITAIEDEDEEWDDDAAPSFIVAGAGDLADQSALVPESIVRANDATSEGWQTKIAQVMKVMNERMDALGVAWSDVTVIDVYTAGDLGGHLREQILEQVGPAAARGVHWHLSHPPVVGLAFEMDVRGVGSEQWV